MTEDNFHGEYQEPAREAVIPSLMSTMPPYCLVCLKPVELLEDFWVHIEFQEDGHEVVTDG